MVFQMKQHFTIQDAKILQDKATNPNSFFKQTKKLLRQTRTHDIRTHYQTLPTDRSNQDNTKVICLSF